MKTFDKKEWKPNGPKWLVAMYKLSKIAEAYNDREEKPLDWDDYSQNKYILWFNLEDKAVTLNLVSYYYHCSSVPPSLVFLSREAAKDCYEKHKELWEDLFLQRV